MAIPRLHKEMSIFDPDSTIDAGIEDAGSTATNYLTTITGTSGISVHDAGDTSNYVNITSGVIDLVTGGISRLKAWVDNTVAKVRVGVESAGHAIFSPDGMEVFTDATTSAASFGSESRVGRTNSKHVTTKTDGVYFYDGSTEMGSIKPTTLSDYPSWWGVTYDSGQWQDSANGNAITFNHMTEAFESSSNIVGGYVYISSQWYQLKFRMYDLMQQLDEAGVDYSEVMSSSQYLLRFSSYAVSSDRATVSVLSPGSTSASYNIIGYLDARYMKAMLGSNSLRLDADIITKDISAGTVRGNIQSGVIETDRLVSTTMAGMIQMFGGSTAPEGWLLCDGSAVSRTTYERLFAVIGTTYGTGNGSTTFNLPNLQGRFPLGSSSSYSLAATGGSADAIVPYHNHSMTSVLTSASVSIASNKAATASSGIGDIMRDTNGIGTLTSTNYAGSSGNATGANMPPYVAVNYIICTGI